MMKMLLLLDCDACRTLFPFSRTASNDSTAWAIHGRTLEDMAGESGWLILNSQESHLCPDCADDYWQAEERGNPGF